MRTSFFTFLLVAFISVNKSQADQTEDYKVFDSFPITENLEHEVFSLNELLTPSTIHLIDTIVVLVDERADYSFHFYDVRDWAYLGKYGKRGNGPEELGKPIFHGQFTRDAGQRFFWFSDFNTFKLRKVNLERALIDDVIKPDITDVLPPELAMTYDDVYAISDKEFVGTVQGDLGDYDEFGRFFRFEVGNSQISWVSNFPKQELKVERDKIGYLYSSRSTFNPATKQIASAMKYYDRLDVIDVAKNNVLTIVEKGKEETEEVDMRHRRSLIPPDVKTYSSYVNSSEKYIYQLYRVSTGNDEREYFEGNKNVMSKFQLRVFDWEGNPVYRAVLDSINLFSFFIDEVSWKMYAINYDRENENEFIMSYDLKKFGDN